MQAGSSYSLEEIWREVARHPVLAIAALVLVGLVLGALFFVKLLPNPKDRLPPEYRGEDERPRRSLRSRQKRRAGESGGGSWREVATQRRRPSA